MTEYRWAMGAGSSNRNCHGTQKKGEPWNKQTVKGWKAKIVQLEGFDENSRIHVGLGYRLIIYKPSGAWWNFDLYKTRRKS